MQHKLFASALVGAAALWSAPCYAAEVQTPAPEAAGLPVTEPISSVEAAPLVDVAPADSQLEPARLNEPLAQTVPDDELDNQRGGETLMLANQTLLSITSGNVIEGGYTAGSISLSDFALSNFNGIGNVLFNTGGQASLQAGMNLTINVGD